jgi:hypothetical protein
MSIASLADICVKTKGLQRTLDFYCAHLGTQKLFDFTQEGEALIIACQLAQNETEKGDYDSRSQ